MKTIVIGGGIVGLSTAWALESAGHNVTLLERGDLPNPTNASTNPQRLIRHPYGDLDGYCSLVDRAFAAWHQLWETLGSSYYVPTGTLALSRQANDWADRSRLGLQRLGVAHRVLEPERLAEVHAALAPDGVRWAMHLETGGVLLSDRIALTMVRYLEQRGVDLRPQTTVLELDPTNHTVTLEDGQQLRADALVIAAGAQVTTLLPNLAPRVHANRKVNLYLQPPAALSRTWANAPIVVDLGGEMAGVLIPPVAGTPIRFGAGIADRPVAVDRETEVSELEADTLFGLLHDRLVDFAGHTPIGSLSCHHVSTSDEHFILEPLAEQTWLVSGCSGHMYKFGPLIGQVMARALEGADIREFTDRLNADSPRNSQNAHTSEVGLHA